MPVEIRTVRGMGYEAVVDSAVKDFELHVIT